MDSISEIMSIILPLIIVAMIAIFVVLRMVDKNKKGTLGRKQSEKAQNILDSLIPLGAVAGSIIALILSLFTAVSILTAVTLGPAIGLLLGYFAYEIYSKN